MTRKKWRDRLKAVEQRALSYQSAPICCPYKARLSRPWQPSSVWRLFPRQSAAVAFGQRCKQDVHVFALEKESADAGQRVYLVTSYTELWHYYSSHRESLMHCYEVIPEGAVCKLYFDLEYHVASNPHLDGKRMVESLIQYVCMKLDEVFGVRCSPKDVLNLDSSTPEKFSRHLIFLLPDSAFKDNRHAGRFIRHILRPALDRLNTGSAALVENNPEVSDEPRSKRRRCDEKNEEEDLSFVMVKSKDGLQQLFVDLGVYTKNRNFRLYKSSKAGKNAAFAVAEDNLFVPKPDKHRTEEEWIFLASLITNVCFTGQRILTYDPPEQTSAGAQGSAPHRGSRGSELAGERQASPYKELDDFVLELVCKDGVQGGIRRWTYFVSEQLLVYDIGKYRWCRNVGRFHKSNNIILVLDLKEEVWYQKCHDPQCREQNYRSSSYPLPQEVCMSHVLKEDEDDQEYLMDELGNIEPSRVLAPGPGTQTGTAATRPQTRSTPDWDEDDDDGDDASYLEALDEVERSVEDSREIPDDLMIQAVTECEATVLPTDPDEAPGTSSWSRFN